MTTDRDPDRIIRAWLDLMPDEAPDHVIADVQEAIDVTSQRRASRWWPTRRSSPMNRPYLAVGLTAVLVVVGGAALLRNGAVLQTVATPTPVPTAAAVATSPAATPPAATPALSGAAQVPIPAELVGRWMGPHTAFVSDGAGSSIVLGPNGVTLSQSNANEIVFMRATGGLVDGDLQLTANTSDSGCGLGEVGTYTWSSSATNRILTIAAKQDACATRSAALAGTWWRSVCTNSQTDCLGDLDPGTYASQYIRPTLHAADPWTAKFGGVTYTVPDGWANHADWPTSFGLTTTAAYAATTPANLDPTVAVDVFTDPLAESQAIPCSGMDAPGVAATVPAEIASLRRIPGLIVSHPTDLTIDGHPATSVDLTVDRAKVVKCGTDEVVEYLVTGGVGHGIPAGGRQRLVLVDIGGGHLVGVVVRADDASQFEAFAASAMPIVESLHFQ